MPQTNFPDFSFVTKVALFSHSYLKCSVYLQNVAATRYTYTKRFYMELSSSAYLLEDLLDFHGAKNNRRWYLYRELSAAMRHLAMAAYVQKHIVNRFPHYGLTAPEDFEDQGIRTHEYLVRALKSLAPAVVAEAKRLRIPLPGDHYIESDFPRISTNEMLKADIDEDAAQENRESIVRICNEFLSVSQAFEGFDADSALDADAISGMVPLRINEVEVRRYEMVIHNLQSSFDSYVIHGRSIANQKLKMLRGHISVVLHLLELAGFLLHFYERHLHETGQKNVYKKVRNRMAKLLNPAEILDRTVNYAFRFACRFLMDGQALAKELLTENVERSTLDVPVPRDMGFHLRPSLLVAKIVNHYGGQVKMKVNELSFDAGSVLDLQWAGGLIAKEKIARVTFEGDERAIKDIKTLASVNYAEDRMGKGLDLPKELAYLR
ncbi:MAG: HPr family phosphocarrier protein [Thermodesulfobacteriota bacterium]